MRKNSPITRDEMRNLIKKIIIRFSIFPVFLWLFTLLPAGTFNYWQVYLYFAVLVIPMVFVTFYFLKKDPKFLERRIRAKEKEKAQIIIQIIFAVIFLSMFIVSGLDQRFGWSNIQFYLVILANIIILSGYILIFFVFKQNSYASRIVEVDINQPVISTGLYSIVRHPMYVGVIIMFIPTPIALGSCWGLLPAAAIPLGLILRILNEEAVLKRDLPGYEEYCQETKYRLIPFIW